MKQKNIVIMVSVLFLFSLVLFFNQSAQALTKDGAVLNQTGQNAQSPGVPGKAYTGQNPEAPEVIKTSPYPDSINIPYWKNQFKVLFNKPVNSLNVTSESVKLINLSESEGDCPESLIRCDVVYNTEAAYHSADTSITINMPEETFLNFNTEYVVWLASEVFGAFGDGESYTFSFSTHQKHMITKELNVDEFINSDINVNPEGHAYFQYEAPPGRTHYTHYSEGAWGSVHSFEGSNPSAAIHTDGSSHIAFIRDEELFYKHNRNGDWIEKQILTNGIVEEVDVTLDEGGSAHVAFSRVLGNNKYVTYSTNHSGSFVSRDVISTSVNVISYASPSIAVDSEHVYIGYLEDNENVGSALHVGRYRFGTNSSWNIEEIASFGLVFSADKPQISLNNGQIYVSYRKDSHQYLYLAKGELGNVSKNRIDENVCDSGAVAFDNDGNYYMVYPGKTEENQTHCHLMMATNASGSRTIIELDSKPYKTGYNPAIAIDSTNTIYISHEDQSDNNLKFIKLNNNY